MYDIKWIREHPDAFDRGLTRRGLTPLSAKLMALDETRRALITKLEQAQARRNAASKDVGQAKAKKDEAAAQKLMAEVAELKSSFPAMEAEEKVASAALEKELAQIPNMPLDDVPDGKDEHGNVEYRKHGAKRDYAFKPKQHFELGEALGMMDFELAAKLSGARFVVLQKGLARLERALGQFMLDLHTGEHGYTEVNPPILVRDNVMFGTAQLPKFEEDQFYALSSLIPKDAVKKAEEIEREISKTEQGIRPDSVREIYSKLLAGSFESLKIPAAVQEAIQQYIDTQERVRENLVRTNAAALRSNLKFVEALETRRWLIPTAEVPLTNLVRESIVDEAKLPLRFTACTPCFRAEAGAAGKTRAA